MLDRLGESFVLAYLRTIGLLEADAARTCAIEDSANGIRSAHAARIAVIAVPNREFRPNPDAFALASQVVESLDDIDVAMVRDLTARATTK